jgi:hypothetical protein
LPHIAQVFRTAKGRPATIRTMFDTLLWTADVQAHRGKVPPPPGVPDWRSLPPEWTAKKLEATYGIGHYEDRKALLHDALDALLKKGVDVEPVYRILYTAQFTVAQWYEIQNAFAAWRAVETERYRVQTNLARLQRLNRDRTTMSGQALRHKPRQTTPPVAPRPRRGPPSPKALMRPIVKALAKAGATGWVRTTLLEATGLST